MADAVITAPPSASPSEAAAIYLEAARAHEVPPGDLCLKLARCHLELGDRAAALAWLTAVTRAEDSFVSWHGAAGLLTELAMESRAAAKRTARVAVLGSYTTDQFGPMLELACAAIGIAAELYAGGYDQYRQEILDPGSGLHAFAPSHVVLAVHHGAADLPELSDEPDQAVKREAARWQALWGRIVAAGAKPVQHSFAVRDDPALGHLAARLPRSRHAMLHALNAELGSAAGDEVALVDCERLAAAWGVPVANRQRPELEPLIGFFVNVTVARVDVRPAGSLREAVRRTQEEVTQALEGGDVPFDRLVQRLRRSRPDGLVPFSELVLGLDTSPLRAADASGVAMRPYFADLGVARGDLAVSVVPLRDVVVVSAEFRTDMADGATVVAWLETLGVLLETAAREVDIDADVLRSAERLVSPVVVRAQRARP